jgi:hypothetical protein
MCRRICDLKLSHRLLARARSSGTKDPLMRVTISSQSRFSLAGYLRSKQWIVPPELREKLQRL